MSRLFLGNVELPRVGSATPPLTPPEHRRKTRMQTRAAAREEMRQQIESPTDPEEEEPYIMTTRYPIRRQPVPVEYYPKSPARKPKPSSSKGKQRSSSSKQPVKQECKNTKLESKNVQQMNPPPPVDREARKPRTKNKRVQTEHSITEKQMRFLKSLQDRHIDLDTITVLQSSRGEHFLITREDATDSELEEINIPSRNLPSPPLQMPIRQRSPSHHAYLPPSISGAFFCHDISRYCDDEPLPDLHRMSNNPINFLQTAAYYINTQFQNNPHNINQYGLPRWCPKPNYYPLHAPWGA